MERRLFLSNVIIGSTGIAIGSSLFGISSCSVLGSNKIVLALIGCGARGIDLLAKTCDGSTDMQVKYVCDVNEQRSANAAEQINKKLGYSPVQVKEMRRVFEDNEVNTVIIATPEHWHALAAIMACKAGKDVFVEANLAHTLWEGKQIQEAASHYKRIVQVGFQHRSAGYASTAREYIKSGKLGQIIHVKTFNLTGGSKWIAPQEAPVPAGLDWNSWLGPVASRNYSPGIYEVSEQGGWNNYWSFGSGALSGETSHLFDLARMVLGDPGHPASVYCSGGNWCWGSERETPENQSVTFDYGKYAITCETGNAMHYMASDHPSVKENSATPQDWMRAPARIEIYGNDGLMYLGLNGTGWQVIGKNGKLLAGETGEASDKAHCDNFIKCVRERNIPASSAEQGHLSSALVHLGNIACRVGNKQLLFDQVKEVITNNDQANEMLKTIYREGYVVSEIV